MGYKTIKVSDDEYELVIRARNELASRGLRSLDNLPIPRNELPTNLDGFALGAIVGLGVAALFALLTEND